MSRASWIALFLLLPAAGGAQKRLAVVDVASPSSMIGLSSQITQALVKEAKAQGYNVILPDDLRATLGGKPYEELQTCGGRPECVARKLEPLGADKALTGALNRDEKSYLIKLWLIDVHGREVVADVDRSIFISSRRLMPDVNLAIPGLLRGEKEARGFLEISANVKNVRVTVDGEFAGKTPVKVEVKPGKHEVRLDKKAYLSITRFPVAAAHTTTPVEERLLLIPGETPEEEELPAMAAAGAAAAGGGLRIPSSAWVAAGFGAASAVAGGVLGYLANRTEQKLKAGYDAPTGIYAGTRAQALSGKQQAVLANIFFVGAGLGAATAVVLTVLGDSQDKVQVTPAAGPGGAGVLLQGRF